MKGTWRRTKRKEKASTAKTKMSSIRTILTTTPCGKLSRPPPPPTATASPKVIILRKTTQLALRYHHIPKLVNSTQVLHDLVIYFAFEGIRSRTFSLDTPTHIN